MPASQAAPARRVDYHAGASHRQTDGAFADLLPEDDQLRADGIRCRRGCRCSGSRGDAARRPALQRRARAHRSARSTTAPATPARRLRDEGSQRPRRRFTHAIGSRFTGTATFNYFRYESRVGRHRRRSAVCHLRHPRRHAERAVPERHAAGPTDRRRPSSSRLPPPARLPAPGQFLASRPVVRLPVHSVTGIPPAGVPLPGRLRVGGGQRLSAGYEWERESNPDRRPFRLDNNAFFVQQQVSVRRSLVRDCRRARGQQGELRHVLQPQAVGRRLPAAVRGGAVSSLKVFGNIGRGIKSPTFSERFGGPFADPSPDLEVERARTATSASRPRSPISGFARAVVYFDNDYTDQVAFRSGFAGDGIPEYINIDGSKAHGWELELALQRPARRPHGLGQLRAGRSPRWSPTISTSQQFQPGQPLLRRPKHSGTIRAAYARGRATLNFNMRIVGDRHDNSFLFLRTVPNAAAADVDHHRYHGQPRLHRGWRQRRLPGARSAHRVRARRQRRRRVLRKRAGLPSDAALVHRRRAVPSWRHALA